jgi:hypothetical protein
MAPRVTLSNYIAKSRTSPPKETDENKSGWDYRIKFQNSGRRPIIDLEVRVYVRIKGLYEQAPGVLETAVVPLNSDGDTVYSMPFMPSVRKNNLRIRLALHLNQIEYFRRPAFPQQLIRDKATQHTLLLEDILTSGNKAEIRVVISGFDELTGARKVVVKMYKVEDIKEGEFQYRGLSINEGAPNVAMQPTGSAGG